MLVFFSEHLLAIRNLKYHGEKQDYFFRERGRRFFGAGFFDYAFLYETISQKYTRRHYCPVSCV
jgi:hypothetical protein